MVRLSALPLLLAAGGAAVADGSGDGCLRVLFVGNSFFYGPAPAGQAARNNLPRMFKLVAESKGHCVIIGEDTIGGCSLYVHRPSVAPDGCAPCVCPFGDNATCPQRAQSCACGCQVASTARLSADLGCTVNPDVDLNATTWPSSVDYHPCPQLIDRGPAPGEHWDVVILQDYSTLPTVRRAREEMMLPAVREYANKARHMGARVAMFMTWAYYQGSLSPCPGSNPGQAAGAGAGSKAGCFPIGGMDDLVSDPPCNPNVTDPKTAWQTASGSFPCMGLALARGYAHAALDVDAGYLVPAGLAWQVAFGHLEAPPQECTDAIDAGYPAGAPTGLPANWPGVPGAGGPWTGAKGHQIFRWKGGAYASPYCDDGCHHDQHPSVLGQYLNALVLYATLFDDTPVGATTPNGQIVDGDALPGDDAVRGDNTTGALTGAEAATLQGIACRTVAANPAFWRRGGQPTRLSCAA